jgi:hypothetical protein
MPRYLGIWQIVALWALLAPAAAQVPRPADGPRPIAIAARPIPSFGARDQSLSRFGKLAYRGGLELTSTDKAFGGLSGLQVMADGRRFIAVTDRGNWLRGEIRYDGAKPAGIVNAEMAPMLDTRDRPLARRGWYDTEAMTANGGMLYVGIERVQRIVRFDYGRDGLSARGKPVPVPPAFSKLPSN